MNLNTLRSVKAIFYIVLFVLLLLVIGGYFFFFSAPFRVSCNTYLYVDKDDNADSVSNKLEQVGRPVQMVGFRVLMKLMGYEPVRTGRYLIDDQTSTVEMFRRLSNGMQIPVRLTIAPVRTIEKLGKQLEGKLMIDSAEVVRTLKDSLVCSSYGFNPCTILCMFVPNTYEVYWDVSMKDFMSRMYKEYKTFWNEDRLQKAKSAGLTPVEVMTLASIVDEETAQNVEKSRVAGMYMNRIHAQMPLQADPTIKYALKQFGLRRIYHKHLSVNSPYNTYQNLGLPPGPIRIPLIETVDAVLSYEKHSYLYMCAKEDFSGTHNFASTYSEHLQNARRYADALDRRKIN